MKKRDKNNLLRQLKEKRRKIDLIDQKLLFQVNQRLSIALELGRIKRERGEKIYNPKREKEILKKLKSKNRGPLKGEDLEKIFKKIMIVCRKSQSYKEASEVTHLFFKSGHGFEKEFAFLEAFDGKGGDVNCGRLSIHNQFRNHLPYCRTMLKSVTAKSIC